MDDTVPLYELKPGTPFRFSGATQLVPYMRLQPHDSLRNKTRTKYLLVANLETGWTYPLHRDVRVKVLDAYLVTKR